MILTLHPTLSDHWLRCFPWSAVLGSPVLQLFPMFWVVHAVVTHGDSTKTAFYLCAVTLFSLEWGASPGLCCIIPTLRSFTVIKKHPSAPQSSLQKASWILIRVSCGVSLNLPMLPGNLTMLAGHITAGGVGSKPHTNFPLLLSQKLGTSLLTETHFGPELEKISHSPTHETEASFLTSPISSSSLPLPSHRRGRWNAVFALVSSTAQLLRWACQAGYCS